MWLWVCYYVYSASVSWIITPTSLSSLAFFIASILNLCFCVRLHLLTYISNTWHFFDLSSISHFTCMPYLVYLSPLRTHHSLYGLLLFSTLYCMQIGRHTCLVQSSYLLHKSGMQWVLPEPCRTLLVTLFAWKAMISGGMCVYFFAVCVFTYS